MFKMISLLAVVGFTLNTANADHRQYDMRVDGLTCPFCIATSSKALKRIDGVYEVAADLDTGIVSVCAEASTELDDGRMNRLFRSKGFTYRSQTVAEGCTITNIAHSETGENLTDHDHPHPAEEGVAHEDHEDHSEHHGHGS